MNEKQRFFAWSRLVGFASVLVIGTTAVLPVTRAATPYPSANGPNANGSSNMISSANSFGDPTPTQTKGIRSKGLPMEVTGFKHAVVPLPPAFIVLVSAVVGIAVLGGRRHRKRGKRYSDLTTDLSTNNLTSRLVL
jgi:hypothetical protein